MNETNHNILFGTLVAHATDVERASFYRKTYTHLALAVLAFIIVESILLNVVPETLIFNMISGRFTWLFILGAFWLASILANKWTMAQSRSTQYMGLGLYVILEAIIFLPMMLIATVYSGGEVLYQAVTLTLALFAGLSGVAFVSKTDFSFLRTFLVIGGFLALGLIVAGAIFGFTLGLAFSVGMVLLASGGILYQTQQIKNQYTTNQYVGAALLLFSSVMLLFFYILRIFTSRD